MIANGLIKALPKQRFQSFINMIKMVDIKEQLTKEKQLEDLREKVRTRQKDLDEITVYLTH
jgi:mevalonate kinase